jgi:hypothetical protein
MNKQRSLVHTYQNRHFAGIVVQEAPNKNRVKINAPQYYQHCINAFKAGDWITITVTNKRPKRTVSQNNYYWGAYLPAIAEETGEFDVQLLHERFKKAFLLISEKMVYGEVVYKTKSTTDLSVLEFGEFMEKIHALTGIEPPPTENYFAKPIK